MRARWSIVVPALLVLGGCSTSRQAWVAVPHGTSIAWDGSGQDPNVRRIRHARVTKNLTAEINSREAAPSREAALATLPAHSREWVSLRREIDAAEDARIAKLLVICT